jgi:hypothetical protein
MSKMEVRLCSLMGEMRGTTRTRKMMRSALRCSTCDVHELEAREIGEHGRLGREGAGVAGSGGREGSGKT